MYSAGSRRFLTDDDVRGVKAGFNEKATVQFDTRRNQYVDESRHEVESKEKIGKRDGVDDFGIECILSAVTTDTLRAKDCILPSRTYHAKPKRMTRSLFSDDSSVISTWSTSNLVIPLFDSDARSAKSDFSQSSNDRESRSVSKKTLNNDDPWRAAKRGDLKAIKRFNAGGNIDWAAEDEFENIPLYYACHSGAIVDISVVSFLLWVTPIRNRDCFERCRKNAINREVLKVLNDYEKGGLAAITVEDKNIPALPAKGERLSFGRKSSKVPDSGLRKANSFEHASKDHITRKKESRKKGEINYGVISEEKETRQINVRGELPPRPRRPKFAGLKGTEQGNSQTDARKIISEHSFGSVLDDINKKSGLSVSSSQSFNEDSDNWSLGSVLSFRRRRKSKKAGQVNVDKRGLEKRSNGEQQRDEFLTTPNTQTKERIMSSESRRTVGEYHSRKNQDKYTVKTITTEKDSTIRRHAHSFDSSGVKRSTRKQLQTRKKNNNHQATIEYQEKEKKWIIANQMKAGMSKNDKMALTIHVYDSKQQVYIANCHDVSIHIHGSKIKALLIDNCSNLNVIFGTVIIACEVVNCQHLAVQTTGVCPTFAVDKTDGITVWLTKESMKISNFVTSKCTEVNVSIPTGNEDECDRKEVPLPEQFVHKFYHGEVMSHVPGLFG